jgi:hypothetical protein
VTQGARNRPISTFVATFAALSLLASIAPLLVRGHADQSLLPLLDRQTSFAVYATFLFVFVFFFVPGTFREEHGRSLGPWWALSGFALAFASIPAIVSAYISGVDLPQASCVGGLVAAACAFVVLLRAAVGSAAAPVSFAIGGALLFAIPAIEALCWSTGTRSRFPLADLSLVGWLRRLAVSREPAEPAIVIAVAAALWAAVLVAAARGARRLRKAAPVLLAIPVAVALHAARPEVAVKPLLEAPARPGARFPVAVTAGGGGDRVELAFRTETVRVPADGRPHVVLVTLAPGESEIEALAGGSRVRVPLGLRLADPARPVVGVLRGSALAAPLATALPAADVSEVDLAGLPQVAGALETFDAVVVADAQWAALGEGPRQVLLAFGTLSGALVLVGPSDAGTRPAAAGVRRVPSLQALAGVNLRRTIDPDPFDPTLKSLFARPDWQALDLSALVLFLVLYHAGFLAAFLLPLLLDSHKSTTVYVASVGGVLAVVVAVGWWSVRQVFLRDNQVYTQALTFVSVPSGGGAAAARQFRCYASMSGERRALPWPERRDLVDYRDRSRSQRVLAVAERRLEDVWLDRFHAKLLVREDLAIPAPLMVDPESESAIRLRPSAGVPDPLGLRNAKVTRAAVIEPDGTVRSAATDGFRVTVGELVDTGAPHAVDPVARALLGRFRRGQGGRLLVLRLAGVRRLDETAGFFRTEDVEAVLAYELPGR